MAIQLTRGEPLVSWLTYLDQDQNPETGRTFTVIRADRADGTSFADTLSWEETDAGIYKFTAPTSPSDPDGTWYLAVESDLGHRFDDSFDVLATPPIQIVAHPPGSNQTGTSRAELRRMIASRIGDLILVRATEGSTNSQVISHQDLLFPNHELKGMDIICTAGNLANVSQTAVVTVSSGDTRSLGFAPPLPLPTVAGDTFELYNRRGIGWRIADYNFAINHAIRQAGEDHATEPHVEMLGHAYTRDEIIPIPEVFCRFSGVEIIDRRGRRSSVPPTGWEVDVASREVYLKRGWEHKAHRQSIRLRGHKVPPQLFGDADRTRIPTEWLVHEALTHLYQQNTSTMLNSGDASRLLFMERQGADGRRSSILTVYEPNTVAMD